MPLTQLVIEKLANICLSALSLILSPIFALISRTGFGAEICLRFGFLPLPLHYYSPVPDFLALKNQNYWVEQNSSKMIGIDFCIDREIQFVKILGNNFGKECVWPEGLEQGRNHYYSDNPRFGYTSACFLHAMIRKYKPKRIIEIGSGFSTLLISEALQKNKLDTGLESEFYAIEPFPDRFLKEGIPGLTQLIEKNVELIPNSFFNNLESNDVLFIDSSHVIRIGGDINYLYLDVIPQLHEGVIIHIHDIHFPYEYPEIYYTGRKKYFWTEQYLLQALLINNRDFEILLSAYAMQIDHPSAIESAFPYIDINVHRPSSSFYMQRTTQ